jgi:hypothetical protein
LEEFSLLKIILATQPRPEWLRRRSGLIPAATLEQQAPASVALVILDRDALGAAFPPQEQTCIEAQIEVAPH